MFGISYFNPYGVEIHDMNSKLSGEVDGKKITVLKANSLENNEWYIQLMVCEDGKFEKYRYQNHIVMGDEPNIFTFLSKCNVLIDSWLKDLS